MLNISKRLKRIPAKIKEIFLPRLPFFDMYRTEQIIKVPHERDELVEEPTILEHVTANVLTKGYARKMIHDGTKWIIFTEIPTQTVEYKVEDIDLDPGATRVFLKLPGRGQLEFFYLETDHEAMTFKVIIDNRDYWGVSLRFVYDTIGTNVATKIGYITRWDDVAYFYGIYSQYTEKFTKGLTFMVTNPTGTLQRVRKLWIRIALHEVTGLLEHLGIPYRYQDREGFTAI